MTQPMPPPAPPTRRLATSLPYIAVVAAFALLVALRFGEAPVGAMTDDAIYAETARSLAEGRGPVLDVGPDVPAANPGIFPPGFPLLLAPLALAFPASLAALKAVPLLAALLLVPLCRQLTVPGASGKRDAAVAPVALPALVLLNPWVAGWAGRILSDLPYTALSLAALVVFDRWRRESRPPVGRTLLLAGLVGTALLVRSVGLALLLAMAIDLGADRKRRHLPALLLAVAATQAVLLLPGWSGSAALTAAYRAQMIGHSDGPASRLAFMAGNAAGYLRELPVVLWPGFGAPVRNWCEARGADGLYDAAQLGAGVLLLGLIGLGWRAMRSEEGLRDRARLWLLYVALMTLALLNFDGWPSGVQPRLLLPLLPLLYTLLLGGAAALGRARSKAGGRSWLLPAVTALLLSGSLGHNAWRVARPLHAPGGAGGGASRGGADWADPGAGADWLRATVGPDGIVMAPDALLRHVHLRLPVVGCGDTLTAAALRRRALTCGAGWLVVGDPAAGAQGSDGAAAAVASAVAAAPDWFVPAWAEIGGPTRIYRLEGGTRPAAGDLNR